MDAADDRDPREPGGEPTDALDVSAAIVPRPRPGFRSKKPPGISSRVKSELIAAVLRSAVGVVCLAAATLYMPVHKVTPILTGVSLVMIVTGTYSVWRVGVSERRLRSPTRVLAWLIPSAALAVLLAMVFLGPGAFGPSWEALASPPGYDGTVRLQSAD